MFGKFNSALAESAYFISGNGFNEGEEGSVEEVDGWNVLVRVSVPSLLNLGASDDMIQRLLEEAPETRSNDVLVWLHTDSMGIVRVLSIGAGAAQAWEKAYPVI